MSSHSVERAGYPRARVASETLTGVTRGRITASKFKSVCQSDPANPSLSLIMSICHADTVRLRTTATSIVKHPIMTSYSYLNLAS